MTSGIAGEATGLYGVPTTIDQGPFEHALGYCNNRYGKKTDTLIAEPGMKWDYSDPAMAHLSLLFKTIMGQEIDDYMQEKFSIHLELNTLVGMLWAGENFQASYKRTHRLTYLRQRVNSFWLFSTSSRLME
jgi:CubicO group peptidase (beta-lactamase class C family)